MSTTTVFEGKSGQAVDIPQEYRFDVDEVFINKIGNIVILIPKDSLVETFEAGAAMLDDDFFADGIPGSVNSSHRIRCESC